VPSRLDKLVDGVRTVITVGIVGLGKMGLSHLALFNAHPDVEVVGVCDTSRYVLDVLSKYTGTRTYTKFSDMLDAVTPDAVVIATPSSSHGPFIRAALERNVHVFAEKPLTLDPLEATDAAAAARARRLVTQVGYHNRFVGTFREVKTLVNQHAIGKVTHALVEAYGPVVLTPQGATWRSRRREGGGCLYDYAAHALNLVMWYLGEPHSVGGAALTRINSREVDDQVCATLYFAGGTTAQLSANWSDDSYRKMTTRVTLWGTHGRIYADRTDCHVYLREAAPPVRGYDTGWNVRHVTDLVGSPGFYLRGEEYSEQVDTFVRRVSEGELDGVNCFDSAAATDGVIALIRTAAANTLPPATAPARTRINSPWRWLRNRRQPH
jgi:scyllo-inositol 2-dehydrogenase (NADP+)